MRATCPSHLILVYFTTLMIFKKNIMKLLIMYEFPTTSCNFLFLWSKYNMDTYNLLTLPIYNSSVWILMKKQGMGGGTLRSFYMCSNTSLPFHCSIQVSSWNRESFIGIASLFVCIHKNSLTPNSGNDGFCV